MILTGKLLKLPWVGFFAAILGSIVWSYYNRTMTGYYDTDMFAIFLQFSIFYIFLFTIYSKKDTNILWLISLLILYPIFYPKGLTIVYAVFGLWTLYQFIFQKEEKNSYIFIILASISLWVAPIWLKISMTLVFFLVLQKMKQKLDMKRLIYLTIFALILFFILGDGFTVIIDKLSLYLGSGVADEGLHFYQVAQTVREAGKISWETVANRMIGHPILLLLSLIGYILLVIRHKAFIIALPLIGIGVLSHWAGLRFTVYAVPVAAFSVIYLFYVATQQIQNNTVSYATFIGLTLLALYPNIQHIVDYRVPTVLNKQEVQDLTKLKELSNPKDYTLTWWDYGYPIWYYSNTSTLIDGGKHGNDNYIISKLLLSSTPQFVANLSRLSVETYAEGFTSSKKYLELGEKEKDIPTKFKMLDLGGEVYHAGRAPAADVLLRNMQKDQLDPSLFMEELESNTYKLPKKTRDIYLYLPYRMMRIFPTVAVFGNLDLNTGKAERNIVFYPTSASSNNNGMLVFRNGMTFDSKNGKVHIGNKEKSVKYFIVAQNTNENKVNLQSQLYHVDGEYAIIYMKSYGQFVIMDSKTFNSTYVQMFMLGKYDKNLFELVVSSPYSKIYKIKK